MKKAVCGGGGGGRHLWQRGPGAAGGTPRCAAACPRGCWIELARAMRPGGKTGATAGDACKIVDWRPAWRASRRAPRRVVPLIPNAHSRATFTPCRCAHLRRCQVRQDVPPAPRLRQLRGRRGATHRCDASICDRVLAVGATAPPAQTGLAVGTAGRCGARWRWRGAAVAYRLARGVSTRGLPTCGAVAERELGFCRA
jgi:hypothetical protein